MFRFHIEITPDPALNYRITIKIHQIYYKITKTVGKVCQNKNILKVEVTNDDLGGGYSEKGGILKNLEKKSSLKGGILKMFSRNLRLKGLFLEEVFLT